MFTPPPGLGAFRFPVTAGIRLTNASNAPQGVPPRPYPYWSLLNNHRGQRHLWALIGRVGLRPIVLRVDKGTGAVSLERELPMEGEAEGWYFSDTLASVFYFLEGQSLKRFDLASGGVETVFTLDPQHGNDIWQAHSSSDDQVHSATVRRRTADGPYEKVGTLAYRAGKQIVFLQQGALDECQIDKSGEFLIIQEKVDGDPRNRVIDLKRGGERLIADTQGALGHMDVGPGFMVGEDDSGDRWQMTRWNLASGQKTVLLIGPAEWGTGMGHCAVRDRVILHSSNATGDLWRLGADGSGPPVRIAPGMMAVEPSMTPDEKYDRQLRACLDPLGEWCLWASNMNDPRGRFDVFMAQVGAASPIVVDPNPGGQTVTPFETLKTLRRGYPTPMTDEQLVALLNTVAWQHRAEGWGLLYKPSGANGPQPQTGQRVSRDILMQPDGRIWDVFIDAEGKATPIWNPKTPIDPSRFVAPVDAAVALPPGPPARPPSGGGGGGRLKPYEDALAVEFGHACNEVYKESKAAFDPGMIAVHAIRTWHDYQAGLTWAASLEKHVNDFRQEYGLKPL